MTADGRRLGATAMMVAAALLLLGGCATRVKVLDHDPDAGRLLAASPLVAIGGVTVAPGMGGVLAPADAEDAAAALYRAFLSARPELAVWPLPRLQQPPGGDVLAVLAEEYGRLGRLRPDQVRALGDLLAGCRFLALGRLVDDDVRSRIASAEAPPPATGSGTDGSLATTVSTERRTTVTLELFDLATGGSLWLGRAEARDRQRYRYEDRLQRDPVGYLQQHLESAAEPPVLQRRGEYLELPDLVVLMEQAFAAVLERLIVDGG
jgi:hypothetical protein